MHEGHPHNQARGLFIDAFGVRQPAPAPRFDRTPSATPTAPAAPGQHSAEALADWGIDPERVAKLQEAGVVHQT